jgi:predicted ATPase
MARITRIKVQNHRCLVDFEFKPEPINLLVGESGSGKSALFEALAGIQDLVVHGQPVDACFPRSARTHWSAGGFQCYELDIESEGESFHYALEVEHQDGPPRGLIRRERLHCDGALLHDADAGEVKLAATGGAREATFPYDAQRSFLAILQAGRHRAQIARFRGAVSRLSLLKLDPREPAMQRLARQGVLSLAHDGGDFPSWYRYLNEEDPDARRGLDGDLRGVLTGFVDLHFRPVTPEDKELLVRFAAPVGAPYDVPFRDLSDGQRALIVLYALLHASAHKGAILFLDEPDNFVPLPEIQPWLSRLRQAVDESGGQLLIVSHHPEVIDYLAQPAAFRFVRDNAGPVRIEPLAIDMERGIRTSEWLALRLGDDDA